MSGKLPSIRVIIAFIIAAIADFFQILLWPVTVEGAASPISDLIDVVVGACMVCLLGWHWAFLPSFLGKLIPGADLVPFWTGAVFIAGMGQKANLGAPGDTTEQYLPTLEAMPINETATESAALLPGAPVTQPVGEAKS